MTNDTPSECVKPRKGGVNIGRSVAGTQHRDSAEPALVLEGVVEEQGLQLAAFGPHLTCIDAFFRP